MAKSQSAVVQITFRFVQSDTGVCDCGFAISDCGMKNQKYWMLDAG